MGVFGNGGNLCDRAREHYYALLCHDEGAVPEAVVRHVESCPLCREQIRRLGNVLGQGQERAEASEGEDDEETVEALDRQFEHLGERVRCSQAKAFLPALLAESPRIRIPTPITVHVENCPQCAQDLAAIGKLGLPPGPLGRLGRFYGLSPIHVSFHDEQIRATVAALAAFSLDGADPADLDHVSRCPPCRAWMHRQRAKALAGIEEGTEGRGVLLCREIATADLFDYVLPFGLDALAVGRADGRRDAVATHVRACRRCLEKVQSLHRTIYEIADRADSAVSTLYRCDEAEEAREEGRRYRYPVTVQVEHYAPAGEGVRASDGAGQPRRARLTANLLVRRTALATVTAVVVAVFLLTKAPTATGTSVADLTRAIPPNVHIVSRRPDNRQPFHEMWRSKDLNKIALRSKGECVEYDLRKELMKVIRPGLGAGSQPVAIPREQLDSIQMFMNSPLGGVFSQDLLDKNLSQVGSVRCPDRPGVLLPVYELPLEASSANGVARPRRLRILVDPQQRPVQIEASHWDPTRQEWEPETITELTYPTTTEMEDAFKALSATE